MNMGARQLLAGALVVGGSGAGTLLGFLVGLGFDAASVDQVFGSAALLAIPLFGLAGLVAGAVGGARIIGGD